MSILLLTQRKSFSLMASLYFILILISVSSGETTSKAPFIPPDTLHPTKSQFQLNLILNQNRHLPVFLVQFSKNFIKDTVQTMIKSAFRKQPDIAFALLVDCHQFSYDLNHTLGICYGFDPQIAKQDQKNDQYIQPDKRQDRFFRFNFMAPNPSRIKQKGHILSKNHDSQNLRDMNSLFNDDFLAKIIRNEVPDFIWYIEDNYDMGQFLQEKSEFRTSKMAKILYFDQNLQAPLFLKKIAAILDGKIKVGVTDDFKIAKRYDSYYDSILLMEYNFLTLKYETHKILLQQGNQIKGLFSNNVFKRYIDIKKYRDILLDFQHKDSTLYNMSTLAQINQLITHGRIILLEISISDHDYTCENLKKVSSKYNVFLNYICFSKKNVNELKNLGLQITNSNNVIYFIDKSLKNLKILNFTEQFNIYQHLPHIPPRQKISAESQAEMCIKTAISSKRDPVFYWYSQKNHKNTLRLIQYLISLPQVTSLIHFCQIYLPNRDLVERFQLHQNCLFSMINPNQRGQMQKLEFSQALQFVSIKMFLRQLSINQMIKVYDQKLATNSLKQVSSASQLTKQCFNKDCIIFLAATYKFRFESQMEILKELKIEMSDSGNNFVWIDGNCHWDIAKQLKLLGKTQKQIDRSYILYYKQKKNEYSLMRSILQNKYWVKKDIKKWLKSLKEKGEIKALKFGIDMEDKKCEKDDHNKKQDITPKGEQRKKKRRQVKEDQL